jgi:hypothetical protein
LFHGGKDYVGGWQEYQVRRCRKRRCLADRWPSVARGAMIGVVFGRTVPLVEWNQMGR